MALLHATHLYEGNITTTSGTQVLYTVPAGYRVIIRSVILRNAAGSTNSVNILVDSTWAAYFVSLPAGGTAGSSNEWRPWLVLGPGQTIGGRVSVATGCNCIISGSIYTI